MTLPVALSWPLRTSFTMPLKHRRHLETSRRSEYREIAMPASAFVVAQDTSPTAAIEALDGGAVEPRSMIGQTISLAARTLLTSFPGQVTTARLFDSMTVEARASLATVRPSATFTRRWFTL